MTMVQTNKNLFTKKQLSRLKSIYIEMDYENMSDVEEIYISSDDECDY